MGNVPRGSRFGWTLVSVAVLGAGPWLGCADAPQAPVAPEARLNRIGGAADRLQELDLTPALRAQERHGAALMRIPGVVGYGVGLDDDGNPTITVFTLQPGVSGIPARLDDVPTRTVVTGQFVAGALTARLRPAPNGYSIGHLNITAGTLGAVVQDAGGVCYIVSNNHVMADSNDGNSGDPIVQPGPFDGGTDPADRIANLSDFEEIKFDGSPNTIDAAIAEVLTPVDGNVSATGSHFTPTSTEVAAFVGQDVKKTGRTTELTTGEVTEINATTSICYQCSGPFCFRCKKSATFVNQVVTTDMSEGGDSGSLTVDMSNNPVGLLFAGSSIRTIHNPIADVLTRFNVDVVQPGDLSSCSNGGTPVDNPPSVTVTNPTNGSTVSGTVTVTADASDDNGVTQVEFFVDGSTSIGVDSNGGDGWSTSWNTAAWADGSHPVSAEASDTGNQKTTDQVSVTVDNVDSPPNVTITSPSDGSTVSGTVAVTANASDDNSVTQVEFFVDAASIGVDSDGSDGWSQDWDTTLDPDGSHTASATAIDDIGQTTSDNVTVTVDNSGPPPPTSTMHVGSLDGSKNVKGKSGKWEAFATVTVHDESHNLVADASVSASWSGDATGSGFSVTGSDGTVTFGTGNINGNGSVMFTVDAVSHSSLMYESGANHDPVGDTPSITVTHP